MQLYSSQLAGNVLELLELSDELELEPLDGELLDDPELPDEPLELDELPDGPESRYLFHLLSTHEFQEGLKNYRDLVYLADNLDGWQESVDVYRGMLQTREIAYEQRLPRVDASLAAADLDGMVAHKLELDARVKMIEEDKDALGLATEREVDLWVEIRGLEQSRAARANLPLLLPWPC